MGYSELHIAPTLTKQDGWKIMVGDVLLSATEAKQAADQLNRLALEIAESDAPPYAGAVAEVEALRRENAVLRTDIQRERDKRGEIARRLVPKAKLEAAKAALRFTLRDEAHIDKTGPTYEELTAALNWLEEFKA